jgi:DNA-binding transcriptional regulator GbsR (MarR family)
MSILLMAHALDLTDLTAAQKFVLLIMANYANDEGQNVYPSHDTIARQTAMSRRTVVSVVKQLVDLNYVTLEGKRGNRQNIYSLNVNKMCKSCTPDANRCETASQNPLIIKELKDKDIKRLKDSSKDADDTQIAHLKAVQFEMMQALATTTSRVLADNRQMLANYASKLVKLGYTPADVTAFATWWYRYDWRGKIKQAPSPAQVQELIGLSKSKQADNLPSGADVDKFRKLWEEQHREDAE